jgi:hypothetical protein
MSIKVAPALKGDLRFPAVRNKSASDVPAAELRFATTSGRKSIQRKKKRSVSAFLKSLKTQLEGSESMCILALSVHEL